MSGDRDALVERVAWGICEKCYPPKCSEPKPCQGCTEEASAALDIAMEEAAKVAYQEWLDGTPPPEIAAAIRALKSK